MRQGKRKKEWGKGERGEKEGDIRESLIWRQTASQYPTASNTHNHTKYRHYVNGTEVLLVTSHRPKLD